MKKNKLLISTIVLFIIIFIYRWFNDQIIDIITPFLMMPLDLFLIIGYLTLFFKNVKNLEKYKSITNIISLLILISLALMIFLFPFRKIKTKIELKLFEEERNQIIEMIKNKKLKTDELGNIKLPNQYKKISTSGNIHVYQNDEEIEIGFWIFRGMLSKSVELIYSTGGKNLIYKNETGHQIISIEKLKGNWYYVITDY